MLRSSLLAAANSERLRTLLTSGGWTRRQALRFVAGETLDEGLEVVRRLATSGRSATLDVLGEDVTDLAAASAAADEYLEALERIRGEGLDCGVSVKPSQMGLRVDLESCAAHLGRIAAAADAAGAHLTLDMEGSDVTEATVALVERLRAEGHDDVGCAVQSYLHRTRADVERLTAAGASVRLCKGAYDEGPDVAFPRKRDVDVSYARCGDYLMREGRHPRMATHDGRLLSYLRYAAVREERSPSDWEVQMLYGVRDDVQRELVAEGLSVRVYVPYGTHWYAYLVRRMAERPANLALALRAVAGPRSSGDDERRGS